MTTYTLTHEEGAPHVILRQDGSVVFRLVERDLPLARTILRRLRWPIEALLAGVGRS